jgi:hypothetical protein
VQEIPSALQQELPDLENVENFLRFSCLRAIFSFLDPNPESDMDPLYCTDITGCGQNCGLFFYRQTIVKNTKLRLDDIWVLSACSFLITVATWRTER